MEGENWIFYVIWDKEGMEGRRVLQICDVGCLKSSERPLVERGLKISRTVPTTALKRRYRWLVSVWLSWNACSRTLMYSWSTPDFPSSAALCGSEVMRASLSAGGLVLEVTNFTTVEA